MTISFSVLANLVLFSGVATLMLIFIFKDNKVILQLDARFLLICMALILCRMLIPVESPFTNNIAVSKLYPEVYIFLMQTVETELNGGISVLTLIKSVWIAGTVIILGWTIYSYTAFSIKIRNFTEIKDAQVLELADKANQQYRYKKKFRLAHEEDGNTPYVFGIWKPYILIPDIEVTENELGYIFAHEMKHYYRGDLLLKLLCEIFKAVYWWNPLSYILCKLIAQAQEINVDFSIMRKLKEENIYEYSDYLIKLRREQEKCKKEEKWQMGFQKESTKLLTKRIELMMKNLEISRKKTVRSVALSIVMVSLVAVCPNVISFEAYHIPESVTGMSLGTNEIYYLENEDGTYQLYLNEKPFAWTDEIVDDGIPVYSSIEEVDKDD